MIAATVKVHSPQSCAAGTCPHAVSTLIPCACPDCDATTREMCERERAEATTRITAAHSETTPRFADRTFARFIVDEGNSSAYEQARSVSLDTKRGLGIFGGFGLGKSHLAAAVVNACIARGVSAMFVSADEMFARLRETYDPRHARGSESGLMRVYATVPVLAIDDLGKESLSDWTVRTLFSIVNRRYEQNLPLVATSNASLAKLAARSVGRDAEANTYGATIDRVAEMTGTWVEISGRSRR